MFTRSVSGLPCPSFRPFSNIAVLALSLARAPFLGDSARARDRAAKGRLSEKGWGDSRKWFMSTKPKNAPRNQPGRPQEQPVDQRPEVGLNVPKEAKPILNIDDFVARWRASGGAERANFQQFAIELVEGGRFAA